MGDNNIIDNDIICAICLDDDSNINNEFTVLNCNHKFHTVCIEQITNNSCPLCRAVINTDIINDNINNVENIYNMLPDIIPIFTDIIGLDNDISGYDNDIYNTSILGDDNIIYDLDDSDLDNLSDSGMDSDDVSFYNLYDDNMSLDNGDINNENVDYNVNMLNNLEIHNQLTSSNYEITIITSYDNNGISYTNINTYNYATGYSLDTNIYTYNYATVDI